MSLKVVRHPFKSGGKFYPAGTIVDDPAGIKLYKTKVKEKKIVTVDEHNLDDFTQYLLYKQGVDVGDTLKERLQGTTKKKPVKEAKRDVGKPITQKKKAPIGKPKTK